MDAFHPAEVEKICMEIHNNNNGEFSYNLTGGTKPMAFAAYSVAKENRSAIIYTTSENEIIHLDTYEVSPLETRLDNMEILTLSGNKVTAYDLLDSLEPSKVTSAAIIKKFIETQNSTYVKLQKLLRSNSTKTENACQKLPDRYIFPDNKSFEKYDNEEGFFVTDSSGNKILDLHTADAFDLFFCGRWWEVLVADKIKEWQRNNNKEVWQNVKFSVKYNTNLQLDKNEVDILINNDTKLVFVECKSGKIDQTDIYKIGAVRDTYGGDMSQTILVSYRTVSKDLKEKCDDSQIKVFAPNYAKQFDTIEYLPKFLNDIIRDINV